MTICIHFGLCGGCSFQNLSPGDYRAHKRDTVVQALARAGLADMAVDAPVEVPDFSRRRAVFKLRRTEAGTEAGFHAAKSHSIVDMRECLVLDVGLLHFAATARAALAAIMKPGESAEAHVTLADNGLDVAFRWERKLTPALTGDLARAFAGKDIARLLVNNQIVQAAATPFVTLAGVAVALPPHAFLQASRAGEQALQAQVLKLAKGAKNILDLFAGLGTFTFALAQGGKTAAKVHALEQDKAALDALGAAARKVQGLKPVTTERRDLFNQPLGASELKPFDMAVLDPPRQGAQAQIRQIAASRLARVAYVSCDAASFARDAAILAKAGFKPGPVIPIDQFRYSGHIELVAGFVRDAKT
jgi:23S rRNA (uracil1939-C5)-methyltransferase